MIMDTGLFSISFLFLAQLSDWFAMSLRACG
jgi:hypothetical protein